MEFPSDLRYTKEHEWARLLDNGLVRVGVTDYAQDALGDVVYVELPDIGAKVKEEESFGEIESTKSVSDLYAPVTGKIVGCNSLLEEDPQLVNEDPYGDGWLVEVRPQVMFDETSFMTANEYRVYVEEAE